MAVPEEYGSGFIYLMQNLPQDGRLAEAVCLASSAGQVFSLQHRRWSLVIDVC
jgi:hypothetical protein